MRIEKAMTSVLWKCDRSLRGNFPRKKCIYRTTLTIHIHSLVFGLLATETFQIITINTVFDWAVFANKNFQQLLSYKSTALTSSIIFLLFLFFWPHPVVSSLVYTYSSHIVLWNVSIALCDNSVNSLSVIKCCSLFKVLLNSLASC